MLDEPIFNEDYPTLWEALFGRTELQSRFRFEDDSIIFEGRTIEYGASGAMTKVGEWEPTGVRLEMPERKRNWFQRLLDV